jgi:hypothetical protein
VRWRPPLPFESCTPRPFTVTAIRDYAPAAPGVYGLSNAREWIYIGQAENIQAALSGYLDGSVVSVASRHPTGFVFEICGHERQESRRNRLILEYAPVCNPQHR